MPWADAQRLTSIKAQIILHEVGPESVLSELGFEGEEELSPAGWSPCCFGIMRGGYRHRQRWLLSPEVLIVIAQREETEQNAAPRTI